ncbi:MAG: hypothetical protein JXA09_09175 [Anaerolineae bacterium]|nr:hypothetical protein [Anaerolineae bacterium]
MHARMRWTVALLALLLAAALYGAGAMVYWRGARSGTPLQDPMVYYEQYIYPRAWTRSQLAPGAPDPTPFAAVYGPNTVTQPFRSCADRLTMLRIWLGAARGQRVEVSLRAGLNRVDTIYAASLTLDRDGYHDFAFPALPDSAGETYWLMVEAPQASAHEAVALRAIPTEQVGGVPRLNEYGASGNLDFAAYHRGLPGRWVVDVLAEQLLPHSAALRLQQYKPAMLKGDGFWWLLAISTLGTVTWVLVALPLDRGAPRRCAAWLVALGACVLLVLLALCAGVISYPHRPAHMQADALPAQERPRSQRLVFDLLLTLYPAGRDPERRFFSTAWASIDGVQQPCVAVPPDSSLSYPLRVPVEATLRLGVALTSSARRHFEVVADDGLVLFSRDLDGPGGVSAEIDLTPYGGQETTLTLLTATRDAEHAHSGEEAPGLWCSPQIASTHSWLLPYPPPGDVGVRAQPTTFGEALELLGYRVDPLEARPGDTVTVALYWHALRRVTCNDTVFVHLIDGAGEVLSQHDGEPVSGTYPTSAWAPGDVIVDLHRLPLPVDLTAGDYHVEVGLYDLATLVRRPARTGEGVSLPGDRLLLHDRVRVAE